MLSTRYQANWNHRDAKWASQSFSKGASARVPNTDANVHATATQLISIWLIPLPLLLSHGTSVVGNGVNPYVLPVHCHSYSVVSDLTCVWCRINPLSNSWLQQITPIYLNGFTIVTAISIDEVTTWACTFQSSAIRATGKLIRSHRQQLSSSQIGSGLGRGLQTFWSHMQRRMWGWWVKEGFRWQQLRETMEGIKQTSTLASRLIMITISSIPTSFNDLGPNTHLNSTMMGFLAINWAYALIRTLGHKNRITHSVCKSLPS